MQHIYETTIENQLRLKQQLTATDDVVVGKFLRHSVDELQKEPDHFMNESTDGCESYKATITIVVCRQVNDKSN